MADGSLKDCEKLGIAGIDNGERWRKGTRKAGAQGAKSETTGTKLRMITQRRGFGAVRQGGIRSHQPKAEELQ